MWPWTESRVVFIRKPNKERYDVCSSYRHFQSPDISTKRCKKKFATRIKVHLDLNGLLGTAWVSDRKGTPLNCSTDYIHLMLENAERSRLPTVLLNIDIEKAFDSVWVYGLLVKLLEHNISGKMHRLINRF